MQDTVSQICATIEQPKMEGPLVHTVGYCQHFAVRVGRKLGQQRQHMLCFDREDDPSGPVYFSWLFNQKPSVGWKMKCCLSFYLQSQFAGKLGAAQRVANNPTELLSIGKQCRG